MISKVAPVKKRNSSVELLVFSFVFVVSSTVFGSPLDVNVLKMYNRFSSFVCYPFLFFWCVVVGLNGLVLCVFCGLLLGGCVVSLGVFGLLVGKCSG